MGRGRRRILILVILCFSIFLSVRVMGVIHTTGAFLRGADTGYMEYAPGEVLVKFEEDPEFREAHILERVFLGAPKVVGRDAETNELNREAGITGSEAILEEGNIYRLDFSANSDMELIAGKYEKLQKVEYAEPNYIREVSALTPNDPSFPSQWNLNQTSDKDIDAPEAWDLEIGNSGIIIAVIDTGVDWDHPDLSGNVWNNTDEDCDNTTDLDGNGYNGDCRGYDFVDSTTLCASGEDCDTEDNDPMDYYGHGTHCSGIASAVTDNSVGIAGVCWNCTIMPVRAGYQNTAGTGSLRVADIVQALHYAADNGAHVISMSFGGGYSSAEEDAVEYAYGKGVILVASAGNSNTDTKQYPAALTEAIAVSSTTSSDARSSFSNYGPWADVAAPGSSIYSTNYNDTYATMSGTSMAAPHVAGLAGLILSRNSSFSQGQVRSIIRTSADAIGFSVYMGTGRINAHRAVQINSTPVAVLDQVMGDSDLSGVVRINGTANGSAFLNYSLHYGNGLYPQSWNLIGNSTQQVSSGNLTDWGTGPLPDGQYALWLSVFDNSGQEANETLPVTLSNTQSPPGFSNYAINSTPNEDQDVELNVTVTDDHFIDTVIIEVTNQNTASATNYTAGTNLSSEWYFTLGHGNYTVHDNMTWFWYANDTAGNLNRSAQQEFTVSDETPPSLSNYAINSTPNEDQDVELNVTATDDYMVNTVTVEISNTTHTINYTVGTNLSSEWYFTLGHGNYTAHDNMTWFWYANDVSNNLNASGQQELTVANQAPSTPAHSSPVSGYNSLSNAIALQWSSSSDNDTEDTITYYIYINDTLNTSTASVSLAMEFPEGQWNWNLTADDGYENSSRSQGWSFRVDTAPISSINYTNPTPGNGSSQTDDYIFVNSSLSETPDSCLLEWNDGTPANESMTLEGGFCYKNMTGLVVYNYSFRVWANDTAGNWNSSVLREVEISTGAPAVSISPPDEDTWESGSVTFFYSASGANLDYCLIYLNISGWNANQSNTSPVSGIQGSFSQDLPEGDYVWNILCNNTAGGSSWYPSNLTLHVDATSPNITLLSPGNRTYSQNPEVNFSYSEPNPDSCWYWNGSGNTTLSSCTNGTGVSGAEGQNHLILYMNDSAGNTGSGSLYWTLDTVRPLITLISPANASSWTSSGTVAFRYNVSDSGIANCSLVLGGSLDQIRTSITVNATQTFSKSPGNGNHVWQINCTDLGGLENSSLPFNLTVSYSPPSQPATGGGGGGESEAAEFAGSLKSWSVINTGAKAGMKPGGVGAIEGIEFSTKERILGAEIRVEGLPDAPEGSGSPEGEAYQFLEITHKKLEEDGLEKLAITFSVNMSWIEENMIDTSTIALNRHSGGKWNKLPTILIGKGPEQANFTAESPGFSYFAVTGERLRVIHALCTPGDRRCLDNEIQGCGPEGLSWLGLENCTLGCNETTLACNPEPPAPEPEGPGEPEKPPGKPGEIPPGDYTPYILALIASAVVAIAVLLAKKSG